MSYDIVKSIGINVKKKIVTITAHCSNVFPKTDYKSELKWVKNGEEFNKKEIQKDIMWEFFCGNFQGLSTDYGKANRLPIPKDLLYGNVNKYNDNKKKYVYTLNEAKEILYKNLIKWKNKKKGKYVAQISNEKNIYNGYFALSNNKWNTKLTRNIKDAKVFDSVEEIFVKLGNEYKAIHLKKPKELIQKEKEFLEKNEGLFILKKGSNFLTKFSDYYIEITKNIFSAIILNKNEAEKSITTIQKIGFNKEHIFKKIKITKKIFKEW